MDQPQQPNETESVADYILSILNRLLTHPTDETIRIISAKLRAVNPNPQVLATTINVFAKLVAVTPPTGAATLEPRQNTLRDLVSHLVTTPLLTRKVLYEAIDAESAPFVEREPTARWTSDQRRIRTRQWFTQIRFNLFREESEGYAKVISLMWECTDNTPEPQQVFESLVSLIGQFSLDSNRVIELVLSAAAEKVHKSIKSTGLPIVHRISQPFAYILDHFPRDHVHAVIGAMLRAFQEPLVVYAEGASDAFSNETDAEAAKALVSLVSVMITEGRMQVSDVWGYLSPMDNSEVVNRFLQYEKDVADLSEIVSTTRLGPQPSGDDTKTPRLKHGPSDRDVFWQYKVMERGPLHSFSSQKIDLIITLFALCRSKDALTAILGLSVDGEHVDATSHPLITSPLVAVVEALLRPLLHSMFPSLYAENRYVSDAIRKLGGREKGYDVPIETIEELLSDEEDGPGAVVRQILLVLGPNARASIRLLQALCRVFKGRSDKHVVSIMKEVVLPSASLVQSNVALADAMWAVVKEWPYTLRWELYQHLDTSVATSCAAYNLVSSRASYETRYILKRLTTENQRQYMFTLAKITHGQAVPVFNAALDRVQGYPADAVTISPVVEACRRCTDLAIDILLYLILDRMADSRRSRLKEDGINTAQWYATLSLLLGVCLRKLNVAPQHMDAVLNFLHCKLVDDDEPLLIIALSDIIKCVADKEVDINLSAKQIAAHGGGPVLLDVVSGTWSKLHGDPQMCGTVFDFRMERERNTATSALLKAFDRTGIHAYMAVAIARLTRDAVYHETIRTMPLKLGVNIVDRARTSLLQLSQFMDTHLSDCRRDAECRERMWRSLRVVGMGVMVRDMHVPVSSAVALMSPILDYIAEVSSRKSAARNPGSRPSEVTSDDKVSSLNSISHGPDSASGKELEAKHPKSEETPTSAEISSERRGGNDGLECRLSEIIHKRVRGTISEPMLTLFWFSKLNDFAAPLDLYHTEQKRISAIQTVWEKEKGILQPRSHGDSERLRRIDLELRRIREHVEKLETERKAVTKRMESIMTALEQQREGLQAGREQKGVSERTKASYLFLQECILPRCKLSRPEALFCSKFVALLLKLDMSTICYAAYYSSLVKIVPAVLRGCSGNESLCISFLVKETLLTLERWRSNRNAFEAEASTGKHHGFRDEASEEKPVPMKHWQFCQWLFEIHERLANGLSTASRGNDYPFALNSLSLLNAVAEVFPKVSEHCSKIETCVQKLTGSHLGDVRLTATGVLARLRAGKAKRLPKRIFTLKPVGVGSAAQTMKNKDKGTSNQPSSSRQTDTGAAPPKTSTTNAVSNLGVIKPGERQTKASTESPAAMPVGQKSANPSHQKPPNKPPTVNTQELYNQPIPVVGSNPNGNTPRPDPVSVPTPKSVGTHLNPKAKAFTPGGQSKTRERENSNPGKRTRSFDGDSQPGTSLKGEGGSDDKDGDITSGPPLKKARGEESTKPSERDEGELPSKVPRQNTIDGEITHKNQVSKRESDEARNVKSDNASMPSTQKQILRRGDQSINASGGDSKKSIGPVKGEKGDNPGARFTPVSNKQPTTQRESGAGMKDGISRSPTNGRSSPTARNGTNARPKANFQNGRDYNQGKATVGDRYRGPVGARPSRRDNFAGPAAREIGQGRDSARDGARDFGGTRRRESGGYDYGGPGDRRANNPAGDFKRSGSESRPPEGSNKGEYIRDREYQGDGHGTKRRRDAGPVRGSYGYESDGRRASRPRNDAGYDRGRDDGKLSPDRRFNGTSPSREGGGPGHNPNWMDGRRHGDGHDGVRRQNEEERLGWQNRDERDFDGGGRSMRREDRDSYYERQDRYSEDYPRRDDRRRRGARGRRRGR